MSNDRWIAGFACFLFAFIAITSQVFIFWPWLFGAEFFPSSSSSLDSHANSEGGLSGFMDTKDENRYGGESEGYLTMMWSNLNVRALLYLVPFNFSLVMLCWNYYLTMVTDPGSPPMDWTPPIDGSSIEYKKTTHTPRYCRTCDTYKPPRTHHCRTCKRCVLKMDHHCPWVQNCVGFKNYGHFVRFISWTTIATFICACLLILRCLEAYENEQLGINRHNAPTQEQIILIGINMIMDGSVLFGISILTTYHYWCISSNTTTIESWEKDRVLTMIRRGKIRDVKCPYHQGVLANFQEVLGQNPLLWLWPQPMKGNGLVFLVKKEKDEDYDSSLSDDDLSYSASSRTANSKMWFRPFDGTNGPSSHRDRDAAIELV